MFQTLTMSYIVFRDRPGRHFLPDTKSEYFDVSTICRIRVQTEYHLFTCKKIVDAKNQRHSITNVALVARRKQSQSFHDFLVTLSHKFSLLHMKNFVTL